MADNEVERLTVTLEANYADFLRQIDKAVQEAAAKLKEVDDAPKKAKTSFEQLGGFLGGKFLATISAIGVAMAAAFSINSITNFFGALAKGAVDANAQFETFTVQFTTLLGSVEKAQGRINELAQFGLSTPFELPEIVEANRLLQTFGGTALATGENLRRIGDSAAAVNASFKEVSFWTGRMFSSMQAGRPFGEASARLQELGIMSGQVRTKLEDMQKAGASGAEMWAAYSEMIDSKFAGAMDKLSKTLQGVMSNLADFQGMLLREGGADLFEGVRQDAVDFFDILSRDDVKEALVGLAEGFGEVANAVREIVTSPFIESFKEIDTEELAQLGDALEDFGIALAKLAGGADAEGVNDLVTSLTVLTDQATIYITKQNEFNQTLADWGTNWTEIIDLLNRVVNPGSNAIAMFSDLNGVMEKFLGVDFSDMSRSAVNAIDEQNEAAEAAQDAYQGMRGSMQAAADAAQELKDAEAAAELEAAAKAAEEAAQQIANAKDALDSLTSGFQDLRDATSEKLQELEADHGEKITEIDKDFADKQQEIAKDRDDALIKLEKDTAEKRQEIQENTQDALADLEKETAKQREEINEKAQEDLAKLADDTNASIDKLREEHHTKEERETEDHQRDMQRLQDQYLFDLQDAVKARDARAIVDLRRRFQMEKKEKETTFRTDQRREDEDLSSRISDIRATERQRRQEILKSQRDQLADLEESEAEKREEILASQEEQLADLAKNEAEKRQEIEASYQEQMAKAEEHYTEQIARENERYEERRQKLAEAMAQRLEDEAKALADQKDITEEGARAILEALNKTFGIGGDIDALMEEFRARRRQKMTIQIEFDQSISGTSGDTDTAGAGQDQGSHPGQIPGFARGGTLFAKKPTLALFGEAGPEIASFMPISDMGGARAAQREIAQASMSGRGEMRVKLDISGSAPPGIRGGEVDQIAGVLVRALSEAGIRARR